MNPFITLLIILLSLAAGAAIGYYVRQYKFQEELKREQSEAGTILQKATAEAHALRIKAQEEILAMRERAEKETERRRVELEKFDERLQRRRDELENRAERLNVWRSNWRISTVAKAAWTNASTNSKRPKQPKKQNCNASLK